METDNNNNKEKHWHLNQSKKELKDNWKRPAT